MSVRHLLLVLAAGIVEELLSWDRYLLLHSLHVRGHVAVERRRHCLDRAQLIVVQWYLVVIQRGVVESPLLAYPLGVLELSLRAAPHVGNVFAEF
jgi:hypothetical protein